MSRPTIALCMIVKNEAHNLGPLLTSVRGCFDEIHIVDTGSTDPTLEFLGKINDKIAAKDAQWTDYPVIQLHHFDWVDDFSAARNFSFSKAKTDFIMWMDADDSLSDPKAFIKWRDHVMHAAHYWVALYNYAFRADGKVECKFIRERVIRNNHGFKWEYPVHEGILQTEGKTYWPQRASTWWINHRRTAEDRKQDHLRNLKLVEKADLDKMHPRMKFYYGKELFENGQPEKAGAPLLEAIKSDKLDLHDRILSIQYAAHSALIAKAYPQAIDLLMNGLRLMLSRAEYWCLLGDVYGAQGDVGNAISSYRAALVCNPNDLGGIVVVYEHAYREYPHTQLAKLFLGAGDVEKAREHIDWMIENKHQDADNFVKEASRILDLGTIRENLPKTDDVIITCPPGCVVTDWDENTLASKGHGGSETAAIEVAKWIKKKTNRRVKIYHNRQSHDEMPSGVEYHPIQELVGYLHNVEPKAHIAWRHSMRLTKAPSFVWCHDLQCQGADQSQNYDKIIALSGFHKHYLQETNGVPEDKILLGFNGINPDDFSDKFDKDPLKVVFSSSPDRGLSQTIDIVEKAREISGMDIKLHCFYGFDNMKKMGHAAWADKIEAKIKDCEFVVSHGMVTKQVLMKHFKEAGVWLYPADFIETSCITAMEAMCAGTWPIVRSMGALPYTLKEAIDKHCCDMLDVEVKDEASIGLWANCLVEAIIGRKWEKMNFSTDDYSWEKVADHFIEEMSL